MTDLKDIGYNSIEAPVSNYISDPFWYDDVEILWHPDRIIEFFS